MSEYKETAIDYLSREQAMQLTGFTFQNLQYHVRHGNLRIIKKWGDNGQICNFYCLRDLRTMTWPGVYDIADMVGVKPNTLSARVCRNQIEGAVKLGGRWRFPPWVAERVGRWAKNGYPVMRGFTPKLAGRGSRSGV